MNLKFDLLNDAEAKNQSCLNFIECFSDIGLPFFLNFVILIKLLGTYRMSKEVILHYQLVHIMFHSSLAAVHEKNIWKLKKKLYILNKFLIDSVTSVKL